MADEFSDGIRARKRAVKGSGNRNPDKADSKPEALVRYRGKDELLNRTLAVIQRNLELVLGTRGNKDDQPVTQRTLQTALINNIQAIEQGSTGLSNVRNIANQALADANAPHTSEVTSPASSRVLTMHPTAISNRANVAIANEDTFLFIDDDDGVLKKGLISSFPIGFDNLDDDFGRASDIYESLTLDSAKVTVTSNGTVVTLSLEDDGGGDLRFVFSDGVHVHDCTPADTIALTAGTDIAPQINYIYILQSTLVLTVSTGDFPAAEYAAIATVLVQSAASVQNDGCYKVHAWTDHITSAATGHIADLNHWIRHQPATWQSGALCTTSVGAATFDIAVSSGTVLQLHDHAFPAFDTATGSEVMIVNDSVTAYNRVGDLVDELTDAAGNSMSNRYYILVVWGVVSEDSGDCQLMVNLPIASYVNQNLALNDVDGTAVFNIPIDFRGTGFLICALTVKHSTGGNTYVIENNADLRGLFPSTSAGGVGTGGIVTELTELSDVNLTTPVQYDVLQHDGTEFVNVSMLVLSGAGTPEGSVTRPVGWLYTRTDGGTSTTLYVKESGTGNTGWVAK